MSYINGKKILFTSPVEGSNTLTEKFTELGAECISIPMIEIEFMSNCSNQTDFNSYDWIIITSKNGVKGLFGIVQSNALYISSDVNWAVIGQSTANQLERFGYRAHFINPDNTSEEFVSSFLAAYDLKGAKILVVTGSKSRTVVANGLKEIAQTEVLCVYESRIVKNCDKLMLSQILNSKLNLIIFSSPSCFDGFLHHTGLMDVKTNAVFVSIGKTTQQHIIQKGYESPIVADNPSANGFVSAIERYYTHKILKK